METRKPRKSIVGRVVSDSMNKTIAVSVERIFQHPMYKKMMKRTSKIYAHDEERAGPRRRPREGHVHAAAQQDETLAGR